MSKLKISLDDWAEQAREDDPVDMADSDLESAANWVSGMMEAEEHPKLSSFDAMRKHPVLVKTHTLAHAICRLEHTYRTLKMEELRLLEDIANSLESITPTVAQDGKSITTVPGNAAAKCTCRLDPIGSGLAHDWLQAWLADHPGHTRKEHIFAHDLLKWLEHRSNGGRA